MIYLPPKNPDYESPLFTESDQTYRDKNGVIIPRISWILKGIPEYEGNFNANNQEWGKARHMVTQLYDEKDLNEATVEDGLKPALEAWKAFVLKAEFQPLLIEQPLMHQKLRFAGRPDKYGLCFGLPSIVEIKPKYINKRVQFQTAAQKLLIEDLGYKVDWRYSLHLSDSGSYNLEPHDNWRDEFVFKNLLEEYRKTEVKV